MKLLWKDSSSLDLDIGSRDEEYKVYNMENKGRNEWTLSLSLSYDSFVTNESVELSAFVVFQLNHIS